MTLIELQEVLGEQLKEVKTKNYQNYEEHKKLMEKTNAVTTIAKQMINNADVILRTDKLVGKGELAENSITGLIR